MLSEPPRPRRIAARPDAYWFAVLTVCIGAFMGQLDASIVTLAFPTMERNLHVSVGAVQWVGLAYLLTLVGCLTAVGRYADMAGRKLLYTYGFLVFIVGSALCGFAPDLPMLVGFRVLQAIGAAMLQANSVAIITAAAPRAKLGRAIGVQGAAQALGLALGPAAGGLLIAVGGWRLIFLVNVPVGLVATALAWLLIPRSRYLSERAAFDWAGLGLFVPAPVALMLVLSLGNQLGWASPVVAAMVVVTALFVVVFVRHERRARSPMVDLALFRVRSFSLGLAMGWLIYMAIFGVLFVVPYLLELALHRGAAQAGLLLLTMPLALGLAAPLAGRAADHLGARPLLLVGMSLATCGLVAMALSGHNVVALVAELMVTGAGLGLSASPNNAATMGSISRLSGGVGSGLLNMARGLGTAVGLAVTGLVFTAFTGNHPEHAPTASVLQGFRYAVLVLAAMSALALVLSRFDTAGELSHDPTATSAA